MLRRGGALVIALVLAGSCGSGDEGSIEALCRAVRTDSTLTATFQGFDPTDVESALERLRQARVSLGELRDAGPAEARADLSVEIAYVDALIDGLGSVSPDDPARAASVVQQVTAEHPDVEAAAANLTELAATSCR